MFTPLNIKTITKMRIITLKLILLLLTIFIFSCQNDMELFETKNNETSNSKLVSTDNTVINNRFVFSSKESLSNFIKELNNKDTESVEEMFSELYQNGFRSHSPIVNPKNEELIAKLSEEYLQKKEGNKPDPEINEGFIDDPIFATLIENNNEIIIKDSIYKFVKNNGLFFSHIKDSTYLFDFLKKEKDVKYLEGVIKIDDHISHYKIKYEEEIGEGGGSGGVRTPIFTDAEIQAIIDNLGSCDINNNNWFQNLFGKSLYCTDYFDSKHRIKTRFWDKNWLIYASAGVSTKTQRKRFWFWWSSNSDEIHLGINRILLKYNFTEPNISSSTHPQLFNNTYKAPLYLYNGTYSYHQGTQGTPGYHVYPHLSVKVTQNNLPFFKFDNEDLLNIYIPNVPIVGDYNLNLTTQDILSQSNIQSLYQMGIDFLRTHFNSGAKKFAVTYQKSVHEIVVIYFGVKYKKTNDNKLKKIFYDDINFKIGITLTENGNSEQLRFDDDGNPSTTPFYSTSFSFGQSDVDFRDYTHYELDFYGIARRGNTWRGSRLIK